MNKSESIQNLSAALSKAQAEYPAIKFDSVNPFLKNGYASLGAIIAGARPVNAKHGLSVSQLTFGEDGVAGVETVLMHTSGEWISSSISMPIGDEKGKSNAQVAGSIVTYLRRYSLASILGIYSDEDGDGNKVEPERKPTRTALPKEKSVDDPMTDFLVETFAVDAPVKVDSDPLTIERACKVKSDSAGKTYGELTIGELSVRYNALVKAAKDNSLSPEVKADKEFKMRAAKMVIDAKRNKEI